MEKCKRMKRQRCMSKNWNVIDCESPRKHASSIVAWKALRWKRKFLWMDQRSKTSSHLKGDWDTMQYGELRSYRGSCERVLPPVLIFQLQWHLHDRRGTVLHFFDLVFFTNDSNIKWQGDSRKGKTEWAWFLSSACVKLKILKRW